MVDSPTRKLRLCRAAESVRRAEPAGEQSASKVLRLTQLIVLVDYAAVGAMRTVLPYYAKRLGASGTKIGALETAYGLGQVGGALMLGWLSDARGRKFVLLLSFVGAATGYAIASLAVSLGSVALLLASRLPVGLAKQTVTATRALVADLTPASAARSEALARLFAGCSLGYAVGPYLGGLLADATNDASPLPALVCSSIFLILIPAVSLLLPETAAASQPAAAQHSTAQAAAAQRPVVPGTSAAAGASAVAGASAAGSPPEQALNGARNGALDGARDGASEPWLLLVGCTLPDGALVMFSSTSLALLGHRLGWSASQLGLYNSCWGIASGMLSLTLWPRLLASGERWWWELGVPPFHPVPLLLMLLLPLPLPLLLRLLTGRSTPPGGRPPWRPQRPPPRRLEPRRSERHSGRFPAAARAGRRRLRLLRRR